MRRSGKVGAVMWRNVMVGTTAVILAVVTAGGAMASSPSSASGSGHTGDGPRRTFAFTAVERSNGTVTGRAQLNARADSVKVHLRVTCLRVEGSTAYVSGIITNAAPEFYEGVWAIFGVQDNGEGAGGTADLITQFHPASIQGPNACLSESPADWMEVQNGNIRVS